MCILKHHLFIGINEGLAVIHQHSAVIFDLINMNDINSNRQFVEICVVVSSLVSVGYSMK